MYNWRESGGRLYQACDDYLGTNLASHQPARVDGILKFITVSIECSQNPYSLAQPHYGCPHTVNLYNVLWFLG